MNDRFIPKDLVVKCENLVKSCHKRVGWDNLPAKISTRENMVALACMPDMLTILRGASGTFKIRIFCWFVGIAIIVSAWFFSWWILIGLLLVFVTERRLSAHERKTYMFLSAILSSLEMLAIDFAGWGHAYPEERVKAISVLSATNGAPRSGWLDYYLPRRKELESSLLKSFGPQ